MAAVDTVRAVLPATAMPDRYRLQDAVAALATPSARPRRTDNYAQCPIVPDVGLMTPAAPMGAPAVKRAYWSSPVTSSRRGGVVPVVVLCSQLPGFRAGARSGSSWSARSLGRPAGRRRGRTSLTRASGGR